MIGDFLEIRGIDAKGSNYTISRKWANYFMGFAYQASVISKDSTKVGAVLVGPDKAIMLSGFNGPPIGVQDSPERRERPAKYLFTSHAEANIISFAARKGIRTEGCDLFVTHHPCASCARSIIQAGINRVFYANDIFGEGSLIAQEILTARQMFCEAEVTSVKVRREA